jgi:RNA polymerase sigma-70 factor, ECF subfamily
MTITRHQCIDELRRRRVRPVEPSGNEELRYGLAAEDDPAEAPQYTFERECVRTALQRIPVEQRTVIELAFWGGMTQQENALHCHSPLGTVKARLRLGMQRLKLLLQESD